MVVMRDVVGEDVEVEEVGRGWVGVWLEKDEKEKEEEGLVEVGEEDGVDGEEEEEEVSMSGMWDRYVISSLYSLPNSEYEFEKLTFLCLPSQR